MRSEKRGSPRPGPPPEYRGRGKRERVRAAEIVRQAAVGASLFEMAAYHEVDEAWLKKVFGRAIVKAWARRNIAIRAALTAAAVKGNVAALRRVTELDRSRNEREKERSATRGRGSGGG
jgi:hypothetical protein